MANFNQTTSVSYIDINSSTISSLFYENTSHLSTDEPTMNSKSLKIVESLTTHITLIVTIIGLIGNACTIIVLNRQSMRKWRSSMLLSALAAVDFLYLLIIFLSIIDSSTNNIIGFHRSLLLCQATVYITHVCSFLSVGFTLSFTLQRFVAVTFPLHANKIISKRSSIINIILLVCFGCSFYLFSFFLTNISRGQCREDEKYPMLYPLLIVDTCLTFVLPFICILVFNCAIVYKLRKRKRFGSAFDASLSTSSDNKRILNHHHHHHCLSGNDLHHERQRLCETNLNNNNSLENENDLTPSQSKIPTSGVELTTTTTTTTTPNNGYFSRLSHPRVSSVTISNELTPVSSSSSNPCRQNVSQRTTKMLVICSTTFLIFNSPYCAVLLYSIISKNDLPHTLSILRHFYFMSFCLNFFLYSLCGNRFRHELILLFKLCCRKCCSQYIRTHWLHFDKIPKQNSFTRITNRQVI